jgi:hypothetical protein
VYNISLKGSYSAARPQYDYPHLGFQILHDQCDKELEMGILGIKLLSIRIISRPPKEKEGVSADLAVL